MYKQLISLQEKLQNDKKQLEQEISDLLIIVDAPETQLFNESLAASQITEAKTKDHFDGTKNSDKIIKAVDKARIQSVKNNEESAALKVSASDSLLIKSASLSSLNSEITALDWKIKECIHSEARKRLACKVKQYHKTAVALLNDLIEIDALKSVFTENPNENPAKYVFSIDSLPIISLNDLGDVAPWQVQASGEKLVFTREYAFQAVHNKHLAIIEEIKGALHGK